MSQSRFEELYDLVRSIPPGKVTNYGELGRAMRNPVSGLLVGRWMSNCPEDIPWWRVVGADGRLPIWKRGPEYGGIQHDRLIDEGVDFEDGKVIMEKFSWAP